MLKSYRLKFLAIILILTISTGMYGQNSSSTSTPYSWYGFGTINSTSYGRGDAMGGIGIGVRNNFQINPANPASYTSIDSLTFLMQFGVDTRITHSETNSASNTRNNVNFGHLTFALPLTRWWASSFGLLPYASKGYDVNSSNGADDLLSKSSFSGSGTLTKFYWGNAVKMGKHLSFGVNTYFLFGKINDDTYISYPNDNKAYDYLKNISLFAHGLGVTGGLQYHVVTKNKNSFTLGATFEPKVNVNSTYTIHEERALYRGSSTTAEIVDTISHVESSNKGLQVPMSYGTGFSYSIKDKFTFGADVYFQQWKEVMFLGQKENYLSNSSRYSTGFEYVPNFYSIRSYWDRVAYRAGVFYENSNLTLNGVQLKTYGVTFGVGMPMSRSLSKLNFSCEIGQFGTKQSNLIKETYAKFAVHVMLWDRWFMKSKFD